MTPRLARACFDEPLMKRSAPFAFFLISASCVAAALPALKVRPQVLSCSSMMFCLTSQRTINRARASWPGMLEICGTMIACCSLISKLGLH